MRPWLIALLSGTVGLILGWLTRPLIEGRGIALTASELWHHAVAEEDALLHAAAHQTASHIGLFGLACALLGYVAATMSRGT